jgi:hypothetical protein
MSFENLSVLEKVAAGTGTLGLIAVAGMKAISFFRAEKAGQTSSAATAEQFEAFRQSIKAMSVEMELLRGEFHKMDRKVHMQQRTITKLEMAVHKLMDLLTLHDISIPAPLREEIEELIKPEQTMGRRATDKQTEQ